MLSTPKPRCLGLTTRFLIAIIATAVCLNAESRAVSPLPTACDTATSKDDGSVESGYGFVPSATTGTYVQAFDSSELKGTYLTSVCLCFMKTRGDRDIEFELVVFEDAGGHPAQKPLASIKASQKNVAPSKGEAGAFVEVQLPSLKLPAGRVYIGARWDPSQEKFLFICNDQSEETTKTDVYFSEDRKPAWSSVEEARDPIFLPHRAIMVRPNTSDKPVTIKPSASSAPTPSSN